MTDEPAGKPAEGGASQVEVRQGKKFSVVWIVPIVAALIAVGLGVRTYMQKGPTITITFETADGLEPGKTKVMYRSVKIGLVEAVRLGQGDKNVIVTASLEPHAKGHLTAGTQWWVVRPRIGVGGISGLDTLISGAYIEMDPGPGAKTRTFTGLEVPPLTRAGEKGLKLILQASQLGSINYGSPIYYREIEVGEVTGYRLADNHQGVHLDVFIREPHQRRVRKSTRFWNASGVEVSLDADGFKVRTASVEALLAGGLSFDTLDSDSSEPVKDGHVFELFDDYESSQEKVVEEKFEYVLYFEGTVRGLQKGAPVEFRGIPIGEVKEIKLEYDKQTRDVRIPVLIELVPQHLGERDPRDVLATLVDHGLRAQLQMGNLLTGQLFIEFEMHPDVPARYVAGKDSPYPELPTMPASIEAILENVSALVKKIGDLPYGKLMDDIQAIVEDADKIIKKLDGKITPLADNFNKTLERLQGTLRAAEDVIAEDSPVMYDLTTLLEELAVASRSVRVLSAYLERHPEALIYGKGGSGDR